MDANSILMIAAIVIMLGLVVLEVVSIWTETDYIGEWAKKLFGEEG